MANIIKTRKYYSALAQAPFDRQVDIYKLAQMGEKSSARLFNDLASEAPELARLVVAEVDSQRRESAKVTKSIDKVLARAERKPKVKKARSVTKAAEPASREVTPRFAAMCFINSDNPHDRETARRMLGS